MNRRDLDDTFGIQASFNLLNSLHIFMITIQSYGLLFYTWEKIILYLEFFHCPTLPPPLTPVTILPPDFQTPTPSIHTPSASTTPQFPTTLDPTTHHSIPLTYPAVPLPSKHETSLNRNSFLLATSGTHHWPFEA